MTTKAFSNMESELDSENKKNKNSISKIRTSVQREEREFVVFTYEDELFLGQITIFKENGANVK